MKRIIFILGLISINQAVSYGQNVGIGTTSPTEKLEVAGKLKITSAGDGLIHTDGTTILGTFADNRAGWVGTNSNHPLWLYTNYSDEPGLVLQTNNSVGIGTKTPDNSAILDISSNNRGLMLPRLADTTAISDPKEGLVMYNQTMRSLNFHDGIQWRNLSNIASASSQDSVTISLNGGVETPIRTYLQQTSRTLDAVGRPSSGNTAGTATFTKRYDANSDLLKEHCYDIYSTFTNVIFKFYDKNTGTVYYQVKFEEVYLYGCNDSTDPTNGFIETFLITAKKLTIGNSTHQNPWPI